MTTLLTSLVQVFILYRRINFTLETMYPLLHCNMKIPNKIQSYGSTFARMPFNLHLDLLVLEDAIALGTQK